MLLSSTQPFSGKRTTPKTPGRLPRLTDPKPTLTQRKALGEAYALQNSLTAPTFQMPPRPSLYNPDLPQLGFAGFEGLFPTVQRLGGSDTELYQQALAGSVPPSALRIDDTRNTARLRGLTSGIDYLNRSFDTDPETEGVQLKGYSPYNAPALPTREYAPYPQRQSVSPDRLSLILAALGGIFAPSAAGQFAAAPLTSATQQSQQNWQDALNEYRAKQWIADQQYGDALRGREAQMETDLYNREGEERQATLGRDIAFRLAPLMQQEAEASALQTGARPLLSAEEEATRQGLEAQRLREKIATGQNKNALLNQQYLADVQGAVSRYEAEQKAYFDNLKLAADMGDKKAQRMLDERRINETSRHNKAAEGISQYSAQTGRINATTQRARLEFDLLKQDMERANKDISALVWNHPLIKNMHQDWTQARNRLEGYLVGTPGADLIDLSNPQVKSQVDAAEQLEKRTREELERTVRDTYNRFARQYGQPPLPEEITFPHKAKRDKKGNLIYDRIEPPKGNTSMGGERIKGTPKK